MWAKVVLMPRNRADGGGHEDYDDEVGSSSAGLARG